MQNYIIIQYKLSLCVKFVKFIGVMYIIYNLHRLSAGPRTTCVPPPEVPQGCGLKGRGEGWTCPKTVAQVDSVRSTEN